MFKKLLLTILLLTPFYFFASSTLIHAEDNPTGQADELVDIYCQRRGGNQLNLETWYGGRCDENTDNLEETIGFGDIVLIDLYSRIAPSPTDDLLGKFKEFLEALLSDSSNIPPDPFANAKNPSALQSVGNGITQMYQNPPASSIEYIAQIKTNFQKNQPVQAAYAQNTGFGFTALDPVIGVWRAFRNLAYLVFILAFIYYGFMIMFRMKINPQTVMNIQLAIPKLIITLLLITFSYAIAGFLIDLFYVLTGFIFSIFYAGEIVSSIDSAQRLGGFSKGLVFPFVLTLLHVIAGGLVGRIILAITSVPGWLGGAVSTLSVISGLSFIISLILIIAILYTFIKIWWMLLKSYVTILLQIIFSPIILLGNVFPGSNAFFTWIKNIFAELAVFATIMVIFVLAFYFIGPFKLRVLGVAIDFSSISLTSSPKQIWMPPPLVSDNSANQAENKLALLGVGLMFIAPSTAKSIRDALKVKEAGYGSAIGSALGYGINPLGIPGFLWGGTKRELQGFAGGMTSGSAIKTIFPGISGKEEERVGHTAQGTQTPSSQQVRQSTQARGAGIRRGARSVRS